MHITQKNDRLGDTFEPQCSSTIDYLDQSIKALPQVLTTLLDAGYHLRFGLKTPTAKLLENAQSEAERRIISIVAMLDLDQTTLRHITSVEEWQFIDSCHDYLRQHFRS